MQKNINNIPKTYKLIFLNISKTIKMIKEKTVDITG